MTNEKKDQITVFETLVSVAEMNPNIEKLDLHGMDLYDAEYEVSRFLDQQFMAGEPVVKIIFGVGRGVLAGQVPDFVKKDPHVLYSKIATQGFEGGTVVYAVINS